MFFNQIKLLFLGIVRLLRRALCCFSRRRKLSHSENDFDSLQCVSVVVGEESPTTTVRYKRGDQYSERDWNSWDDSPRNVEEHIEQYRQKIAKKPTTPNKEEEIEPDFFREMVPAIKPQIKYYLGSDTEEQANFSRLEAKTDVPIAINADLEDWMEEEPDGWEKLDNETTKQLIRDKRKELRNQRRVANKLRTNGIDQYSTKSEITVSSRLDAARRT